MVVGGGDATAAVHNVRRVQRPTSGLCCEKYAHMHLSKLSVLHIPFWAQPRGSMDEITFSANNNWILCPIPYGCTIR